MLYNMKEILAVAKEHKFAIPAFNEQTGPCSWESWMNVKLPIHL